MEILMLQGDCSRSEYFRVIFEQKGCRADLLNWSFEAENVSKDEELRNKLIEKMRNKNYHFVFTLDPSEVVAEACLLCGTKYISWVCNSDKALSGESDNKEIVNAYEKHVDEILERVMTREEKTLNDRICMYERAIKKRGGCWYRDDPDYLSLTEEELICKTNKRMKWMKEEKEDLFALKDMVISIANKCLLNGTEEDYEKLLGYLRKNIIKELFNIFPEIYYIYVFMNIYIKEKKAEAPCTIKKFKSQEELKLAYEQLIFYYRRIEAGMPIDKQREILWFINENGYSEYALRFILEASKICDKDGVMRKLLEL